MPKQIILPGGGGLEHGCGDTPKYISVSGVSDALSPKDAAQVVRENVKAELVTKPTKELEVAYARVEHEVTAGLYEIGGLPAPKLDLKSKGLEDCLSNPDKHFFFLRYHGSTVRVKQPKGVLEIKEGNVLGSHTQKMTRIFSDDFFNLFLEFRRNRGWNSELLYASLARESGRYDPVGTINERLKLQLTEGVYPTTNELIQYGLFDRFLFPDMAGLEEQKLPQMAGERPNAVFLAHINLLPSVSGLGLADAFLRQAYAYDHDVEKVGYAFAYARLDGLYKKYVPAEEQARFRRIYVQREETSHIPGALSEEDGIWASQFLSEGLPYTHRDFEEKRADGLSVYSTIRFHERAGGVPICAIPYCAPSDLSSLCTGALIIAPLRELRQQGGI